MGKGWGIAENTDLGQGLGATAHSATNLGQVQSMCLSLSFPGKRGVEVIGAAPRILPALYLLW